VHYYPAPPPPPPPKPPPTPSTQVGVCSLLIAAGFLGPSGSHTYRGYFLIYPPAYLLCPLGSRPDRAILLAGRRVTRFRPSIIESPPSRSPTFVLSGCRGSRSSSRWWPVVEMAPRSHAGWSASPNPARVCSTNLCVGAEPIPVLTPSWMWAQPPPPALEMKNGNSAWALAAIVFW